MNEKSVKYNNTKWLSVHLFHSNLDDTFIKNSIVPFIHILDEYRSIEKWFFIRYQESGQHIRLRIKCTNPSKIKMLIRRYFNQYFKKNPSIRNQILNNNDKTYKKNDSCQFIEYSPEIERYGGEFAIDIAEFQFYKSSETIIKIFAENEDWNYNKAIISAVYLHMSFSNAVGMSQNESCLFYKKIYLDFIPYSTILLKGDNSFINEIEKVKRVTEFFENTFISQLTKYKNITEVVLGTLNNDEVFGIDWLDNWVINMKTLRSKLDKQYRNKKIIMPSWYREKIDFKIHLKLKRMWIIYTSFFHMTNNRLGILNPDESLIAYILYRSLQIDTDND